MISSTFIKLIDCLFYLKFKLFYNEVHLNIGNGVKKTDLHANGSSLQGWSLGKGETKLIGHSIKIMTKNTDLLDDKVTINDSLKDLHVQRRNWIILRGGWHSYFCNRKDEIIYGLSPNVKCVAPLFRDISLVLV